MPTIVMAGCIVTMGMGLSSPPVTKGNRARKVWKYLNRIDRIEKRSRQRDSELSMLRSLEYQSIVSETMEHLAKMGIVMDDHTGQWVDRSVAPALDAFNNNRFWAYDGDRLKELTSVFEVLGLSSNDFEDRLVELSRPPLRRRSAFMRWLESIQLRVLACFEWLGAR